MSGPDRLIFNLTPRVAVEPAEVHQRSHVVAEFSLCVLVKRETPRVWVVVGVEPRKKYRADVSVAVEAVLLLEAVGVFYVRIMHRGV